jgi:hypothetical protein
MTTPEKPQIRNVIATNPKNGQMWICQPIECPHCHAKILFDIGSIHDVQRFVRVQVSLNWNSLRPSQPPLNRESVSVSPCA